MDVELATVDDAETVADLWVSLAREQTSFGSHLLAGANYEVVRDELTRHAVTDRLVVARNDRIVGFVTFALDRGSYEMAVTRGLVENLYVVPDHRGGGIGSELLAAAEERLAAEGAETVVLEAMHDNGDARRFYRRHGYESHRVKLEKPLENDTHTREDG